MPRRFVLFNSSIYKTDTKTEEKVLSRMTGADITLSQSETRTEKGWNKEQNHELVIYKCAQMAAMNSPHQNPN